MSDWVSTHLAEIAKLQFGKTPPRNQARFWNTPSGHPWATIADMRNDPVRDTAETVSESGLPHAGRVVPAGTVLMSFKLTIGRVARAGTELRTNEAIVSVHGIEGKARDDWLYHALPEIIRGAKADIAVKGSTLNKSKLEQLVVHLPPLEEQRRIAGIMDTIDSAIRSAEDLATKYSGIRISVAADLFGNWPVDAPLGNARPTMASSRGTELSTRRDRGDDEVVLRDCGRWLSGGTPNTNDTSYWNGDIPWITASSLKHRYLNDSMRRLTAAGVEAGSRIVPKGTILFVVRGMSLKQEFRVGMAIRPVAFGQDCKALVPVDNINPVYLLFALEAAENRVLRLVDEASHGTGRLQVSLLGNLRIRLPSLKEQNSIADTIKTLDESIRINDQHLRKLRQVRSGVGADLLSGRVRTASP